MTPLGLSSTTSINSGGVAELYTEDIRLQLSTDALRNSVQALELVTDVEAERAYQLEADKAKIKFIEFKYNDYTASIEMDDAAAKAYFEENRDNYKSGRTGKCQVYQGESCGPCYKWRG